MEIHDLEHLEVGSEKTNSKRGGFFFFNISVSVGAVSNTVSNSLPVSQVGSIAITASSSIPATGGPSSTSIGGNNPSFSVPDWFRTNFAFFHFPVTF